MIPNDPAILLSFVNTKLRDFYSNLDDMCDDMELERKTIEDKLSLIGAYRSFSSVQRGST